MKENGVETAPSDYPEKDKQNLQIGKGGSSEERIDQLRKLMFKVTCVCNDIQLDLDAHPFMPLAQRKEQKRLIDAYDDKIRRIKLEISTAQMLAKMPQNGQDITIKDHFQDHPRNTR